jgi:hypothetical protein
MFCVLLSTLIVVSIAERYVQLEERRSVALPDGWMHHGDADPQQRIDLFVCVAIDWLRVLFDSARSVSWR